MDLTIELMPEPTINIEDVRRWLKKSTGCPKRLGIECGNKENKRGVCCYDFCVDSKIKPANNTTRSIWN